MQFFWTALLIVSLTLRYFAREVMVIIVIAAVILALALCGCSPATDDTRDAVPWQHRAMAEIAIVSTTADAAPQPKPQPKVGDRCPDCNDPPGACGVGRVGDGRTCDRCGTCGADGRIDERDVAQLLSNAEQLPERSLTLRMSYGSQKWGSEWWDQRQQFIDAGWDVRSLIHTEGVLPSPVIEAVDGKFGTSFDAPLTLEQLREWSE